MHNILVNDEKEFYLASILETHKNNYLVTRLLDSKKRKIKPEQIFLTLDDKYNSDDLLNNLNQLISSIDTDLLVELLEPDTSYSYLELAKLNYGDEATNYQQLAMLMCLSSNVLKFVHINHGYFRQTTALEITQIQKQLAEKEREKNEFDRYYQVFNGTLNDLSILEIDAYRLLNKTDKQSIIYKALNKVSLEQGVKPIDICKQIGLIDDIGKYFEECFIKESNLIQETIELDLDSITNQVTDTVSLNVFSIDDIYTTEIDDALSVQYMPEHYVIGIHISAPALCDDLDDMIANNISTIYSPKLKVTMLPEDIIDKFSLNEGRTLPVVSIYFKIDLNYAILDYYLRLENVTIAKNLRIEELETVFNQDSLNNNHDYLYEKELKTLYQFANCLEQKRGKMTMNSFNVDYTFIFNQDKISLKPRFRGNPIDKLVSELMILANGSFGRFLTNAFIPAIYRVKQPNYPVKMMLQPKAHTGLNVDYYTWATSPLRRSADFINQKQLIHLIKNKKAYYTSTHPTLLEVVDNFDNKYNKYLDFQNKMERYWSLVYMLQESISHITATFFYKAQVQLDGLPLTIDLSTQTKARDKGEKIKLLISNIDLLHLTFDIKIIENTL